MTDKDKLYYLLNKQKCTYLTVYDMEGEKVVAYNCKSPDEMIQEIDEFCKIFGGSQYSFGIRTAKSMQEAEALKLTCHIPKHQDKQNTLQGAPIEPEITDQDAIDLQVELKVKKILEEEQKKQELSSKEDYIKEQYKKLDDYSHRVGYVLSQSIMPIIGQYIQPLQAGSLQGETEGAAPDQENEVQEETVHQAPVQEPEIVNQDDEDLYERSFEKLRESVDPEKLYKLSAYIHKNPGVVDTLINMIPQS